MEKRKRCLSFSDSFASLFFYYLCYMLLEILVLCEQHSVNPHTLSWRCLAANFSPFCCQLQPIYCSTSFGDIYVTKHRRRERTAGSNPKFGFANPNIGPINATLRPTKADMHSSISQTWKKFYLPP